MERSPADVYMEHCHRRELAYQVGDDGRPVFRPRVGPAVWRVSAGAGTIYAVTIVRPRGDGEAYNIVLVDLEEGFRMMSTVVGAGPEDVVVGARVRLTWRDGEADGDAPVPVFVPADAGSASSPGGEHREDGEGA